MKNSANLLILIALSILLETCSIEKNSSNGTFGDNSSNETFLYLELDIRDKSSYPITMRAITDKLNLDSLNHNNTDFFLSSIYRQGHFVPNLLIYDKVLIELSRVNNDSLLLKYSGQGQQLMNKLHSNSREIVFKLLNGKTVYMRVTQFTGKFAICQKEAIALPAISDEIPITDIKEITDIYIPIEIVNYKKPPKKSPITIVR